MGTQKGYECTCSWSPCQHTAIEKRQSDFDRVTAERDALQQCLTAADERLDVLLEVLRKAAWHVRMSGTDAEIDAIDAALKPADAAKCCTVSVGDQALLDAGDYTPEELFGVGGKPSCPKCFKPAEGGGAEALSSEQIAQFNDDNNYRPDRDD